MSARDHDDDGATRLCPDTLLGALLSYEQRAKETTLVAEQHEPRPRPRQDLTLLRQQDAAQTPRAFRRRLAGLPIGAVALLGVVGVTVAVAACVGVTLRGTSQRLTRAPHTVSRPHARAPATTPRPTAPPASDAASSTLSEVEAVDALVAGRYERALLAYRSLELAHPEKRVYALAVSVLARRLSAGCQAGAAACP